MHSDADMRPVLNPTAVSLSLREAIDECLNQKRLLSRPYQGFRKPYLILQVDVSISLVDHHASCLVNDSRAGMLPCAFLVRDLGT